MTDKPDSHEPQPNKPGGEQNNDGDRDAGDLPAVKNQGVVSPDDYPDNADGKPDFRTR